MTHDDEHGSSWSSASSYESAPQKSTHWDDGPATQRWSLSDDTTSSLARQRRRGQSPSEHLDEATRSRPAAAQPAAAPPSGDAPPAGAASTRFARSNLTIAGRYRLEEELASRGGTLTWRAYDQKLSRPVLAHVLDKNDPRNEDVLEAARSAAIATDSRFLRVLDAASGDEDPATYIVCEFAPGKSLEQMLEHGPLSALEAGWITRELCDALTPMHARGLFHRRLNPDTVIITSTGNVKIVGFLIEAALHPHEDEVAWSDREAADVEAVGRLLYAMLVSRWPIRDAGEPTYGLAPQALDQHGRWPTPRQVQPAVSPALDAVADQLLSPQPMRGEPRLVSLAQTDAALNRVLGTAVAAGDLEHRIRHPHPVRAQAPSPGHAEDSASRRTDPLRDTSSATSAGAADEPSPVVVRRRRPNSLPRRRWLIALVALVLLTLIGSLIAVAVSNGGKGKDTSPTVTPNSQRGATAVPISKVDDFDPVDDGGNGEENPNTVALAWDKKPGTSWTTVTYKGRATMGGLKPGVGLVIDLGQPTAVTAVKLMLVGEPTAVQIMVPLTDPGTTEVAPMTSVKQWQVVASDATAPTSVTLTPKTPVTTRYVLVYLTSLPRVDAARYRGGIAEIEVLR